MQLNVYIVNCTNRLKIRSVFDNVRQPHGILIASIPCNRFSNWNPSPKALKHTTSKMYRRFLAMFDSRFESKANISDEVLRYYYPTGLLYPNFWTENLTTILAEKRANLERLVVILSQTNVG